MPPKREPTLLDHLDASVKAAVWLTAADAAAVKLARMLAGALMDAEENRDRVALSKQLNDVLQSLGLNVAGRTGKAEAPKAGEVNPLNAIRKEAAARITKAPIALPVTDGAKPRSRRRQTS